MVIFLILKRRSDNLQKLTQLSSRSHPRHLVGKRTAQKDTIIDITSDSQVNSNFPYRWSPASLTFKNYLYLFLYLYVTRITINNNAPHLKSSKSTEEPPWDGQQMKLLGSFNWFAVDQPSPLVLPWFIRQTITTQVSHFKNERGQSGQLYRWPQC